MNPSPRRLVVARHAKSDWPAGVADVERPLGRRGQRDAAAAGAWLTGHQLRPHLVWCSVALRTRQTWQEMATGLGPGDDPVVRFDPRVYEATASDLLSVLQDTGGLDAGALQNTRDHQHAAGEPGTVLLLGHNPGVQDLVLALAERGSADARALAAAKFPTCALAVLDVEVPWAQVGPGCAILSLFAVPRG